MLRGTSAGRRPSYRIVGVFRIGVAVGRRHVHVS